MKHISVDYQHTTSSAGVPSGMSVKQEVYETVRSVLGSREISDSSFRMVVFDLGGQEIYYEIHNLFLALEDIALLVFDASKKLNEEVISRERAGKFGEKISTRGMQSNIKTIEMHLQSVYNRGQEAPPGSLSQRNPVVIMVGAHAENISTIIKKCFIDTIRKHFQGTKLLEHLPLQPDHAFHFIGNSNPNHQDVNYLRHIISLSAAPVATVERPISYLEFEQKIIKNGLTQVRLKIEEVTKMANEVGINGEKDIGALLKYYMHKGILLHYPEEELLKNEIFTSPQEVSNLVCTVVTTHHYNPPTADLQQADERYNKHALLEEALFDCILEQAKRQNDKNVILGLLKQFNLAVEVPASTKFPGELCVPESGRVFFVPSLLVYDEKDIYNKKENDIVIVYYFPEKFIPETVFNQLLVKTINWCYKQNHQLCWYVSVICVV